jgi:uncharacterized membrane protein (Fun14 family)
MLMYFIVFTVIGFIIGTMVKDIEKSIPIIIGISILWGLIYAPVWGLACLGELSLGFYIFTMLNQKTNLS